MGTWKRLVAMHATANRGQPCLGGNDGDETKRKRVEEAQTKALTGLRKSVRQSVPGSRTQDNDLKQC